MIWPVETAARSVTRSSWRAGRLRQGGIHTGCQKADGQRRDDQATVRSHRLYEDRPRALSGAVR